MTKVGVISDTHLLKAADLPRQLLAAVKDTDLLLHAGDLASLAILEELKRITPKLYAVWGNMDSADVKRVLPEAQVIQVGNLRIGLTHGSGAPFNLRETVKEKFKAEQLDCIVYGHSHSPCNEVHQGILYFNPGSPTDKVYAPYNSYGLLEIGQKIVGKIIKL